MPVLLKDAVDLLVNSPSGRYIDGTLGGGGHTEEILRRLDDNGKIFSFDKDEEAIDYCRKKFRGEILLGSKSKLVLYNMCFSKAPAVLEEIREEADGILLDLGLSSRQLDESRHGFSYRVNSPLDMRFGSHGKTAEEILHAASKEEIERILRQYGEEPFARTIARRIVEQRRALPFRTTFDLRSIIEQTVPQRFLYKSLSRTFQAFRIAANNELEMLDYTLRNIIPVLSAGARIVVISYHSLEDRIVKNIFKEHSKQIKSDNLDINTANRMPILKILTPKPIIPSVQEIALNPRARSAKLRAAALKVKSE